MAIIDNKPYKLDAYNNKLMDIFFGCDKSENNCKLMENRLVFYDRKEILDMHANSLTMNAKYDVSNLKTIPFLEENEKVSKIIPLDKHWLAAFIEDKKSHALLNKAMYISPSGDGYLSDNIDSIETACVPEEVYLEDVKEVPTSFVWLDEKYADGNHDEFLKKYYAVARKSATNVLNEIIKGIASENAEFELAGCDNISIEEILEGIRKEFSKEQKSPYFSFYQTLDFACEMLLVDTLVQLDRKYNNPSGSGKEKI